MPTMGKGLGVSVPGSGESGCARVSAGECLDAGNFLARLFGARGLRRLADFLLGNFFTVENRSVRTGMRVMQQTRL